MGNIIRPTETWKKDEVARRELARAKKSLAPDDVVPYEGSLVAAVNALLDLAKQRGYPTHVTSEEDWILIEKIVKMWESLYPEMADEYWKSQRYHKSIQTNDFASSKEKGGAQVRHLLEIPSKLWDMIHAVFPEQKAQDKDFALKFARRLPGFRLAQKL